MNHPALLGLLVICGLYAGKLWNDDRRASRLGRPHPNALPGATDAPWRAVFIAIAGCLILVAAETAGEIALGISAQQSNMTWLFAVYAIVAAPLVEELIFRGWLVIENRGRRLMWVGALGASILFAALHPFLWRWDDAGFALTMDLKGWFSSAIVFATSLWLYVVRLASWNPRRSLLPCFAGHAAKNLAVVGIKAATGYMGGAW
jgi:membrane protease YdiL (CAAX protease family)